MRGHDPSAASVWSIYLGFATPTGAVGVGVIAALGLTAFYRPLNWLVLLEALLWYVTTTGMTLLILITAFYLDFILGVLSLRAQVSGLGSWFDVSPLVMVGLNMILGCFMDALEMMIATISLVLLFGYDSVWFGIFLVLMYELALIVPPVGMNLYVTQSVRGRGDVGTVIRGVMRFILCILFFVSIIAVFPNILS